MTQPAAQPTEVKAPIRQLKHPNTGSRITLIGTVHAAHISFFAHITQLIEDIENQGGRIFYETAPRPDAKRLAAAPRALRRGVEAIAKTLDEDRQFMKTLGLVLQIEALPVRDGWETHGLDMLAVAEIYGKKELQRLDQQRAQSHDMIAALNPDQQRALIAHTVNAHLKVVTGETPIEQLLPPIQREIATRREAVVLLALGRQLAQTPDAHIALVWGAGHLPAYTQALTERGYHQHHEEWITAIPAPHTPAPALQD